MQTMLHRALLHVLVGIVFFLVNVVWLIPASVKTAVGRVGRLRGMDAMVIDEAKMVAASPEPARFWLDVVQDYVLGSLSQPWFWSITTVSIFLVVDGLLCFTLRSKERGDAPSPSTQGAVSN